VIVGGGVIGLAIAWRAQRRGLSVVVLERGQPGGGTSRVAAGMIAPIAEAEPTEPRLLALARQSASLYPRFVEELIADSGVDPGYLGCGTLLVARDADEAEALERELAFRQELELPVRRLRASEARELEPALAPTLRLGLEIPDDHAIDPQALCAALAAALGGSVRSGCDVAEVVPGQGVRLRDGEVIGAEQIVIAAGPWSEALAPVELRPVKGQILALRDPNGPGLVERVIRMQPGYLVPRGDGRYVLGATIEEKGFDTTVTAGPVWELLRDAIELVPGVSEFVIEELMCGIRPGTPDNFPRLGPSDQPGVHLATGHYRHGILLAPVTAEIVVEGLLAGAPAGVAS
jgi:glycine oxidase